MSDIRDELNAMMQGTHEDEVVETAEPEVEVPAEEPKEETKVEESTEVETDTKEEEVAPTPDTEEATEEEQPGDTQPDEVTEETKEEPEAKKEDEPTETEEETKEEIDYKQKYEEALKEAQDAIAFRDKVTADFKANKKTVKGIDDPDKIVRALEKSIGLDSKLQGYKSVKPYVKPLKDRGLLEDPTKFDMLMKIADGDTDALTYFMKEQNIDPLSIDTETEEEYVVPSTRMEDYELRFQEKYDEADSYGVGEEFSNILLKEWDQDSASTVFEDENMSQGLIQQLSNGIYDKVMPIVESMKITEPGFASKSSLEQYNAASAIFNESQNKQYEAEQQTAKDEADRLAKVEEEKARLQKEAEEAEYKAKVAEKEKLASEARDKASRVSQPKTVTETAPKKAEEYPKDTNDFRDYFKNLMKG